MGRGTINHAHMYQYIQMGNNHVWACALDSCTHYIPAHMANMMFRKGKLGTCPNCKQVKMIPAESFDSLKTNSFLAYCKECLADLYRLRIEDEEAQRRGREARLQQAKARAAEPDQPEITEPIIELCDMCHTNPKVHNKLCQDCYDKIRSV